VYTNSVAEGQRRKGRPLPTRYETCRGVLGMILIAGLFLLIGLLAENTQVIAVSLLIIFIGVLFEK
jgi:4-hydroxybenzoate polyprenyltransferase